MGSRSLVLRYISMPRKFLSGLLRSLGLYSRLIASTSCSFLSLFLGLPLGFLFGFLLGQALLFRFLGLLLLFGFDGLKLVPFATLSVLTCLLCDLSTDPNNTSPKREPAVADRVQHVH